MCSKILSVDEFETQLRDLAETSIGTGDVNDDSQYGALLAAYRALHETKAATVWEADHQRTALEHYGLAEEFPFGCDAIQHVAEELVYTRRLLQKLKALQDAPALEALLTRDKRGYYNLWVIPGNKKPDAAAPAFTYYDESAVPESLRLPLNGGPAKVRLVMLPAKEADGE